MKKRAFYLFTQDFFDIEMVLKKAWFDDLLNKIQHNSIEL